MPKHFSDEHWSDYIRGLSPALEKTAIEQHLATGCEACRKSCQLWELVAEIANSEARNKVPESLVRTSEASYAAWRQLYLIPRRARMARLIFDSLLEPLPSGVRGASPLPRRILGSAGEWSFDLSLEPVAPKHMFLTGQILRPGEHPVRQAALRVLLMRTDAVVAETTANQFGEFQLQFHQANDLRIYIDVPGDRPVGILLPHFDTPPAAGETHVD
jgi:hypothetical protein